MGQKRPDQEPCHAQGQRHGIVGDSVDEISRSVQRIDDPAVFGLAGSIAGKLIFLAEYGMVGKCLQNASS